MVKKHTSTNSGLSDIIRDLTKKEREALISILNDKEDGDSSVDLDGEIESGSGGGESGSGESGSGESGSGGSGSGESGSGGSGSGGLGDSTNIPTCRICWEPQTDLSNVLISPCHCNGSMKWIHRDCLAKWIETSKHKQCQECHYKYKYKEVYTHKWHKWIDNIYFSHGSTIVIIASFIYLFASIFRKIALTILNRQKNNLHVLKLPPTISTRFILEGMKGFFIMLVLVLPWMDRKGWINLNQIEGELLSDQNVLMTDFYGMFYKAMYLCVRQIIKKNIKVQLVISNVSNISN